MKKKPISRIEYLVLSIFMFLFISNLTAQELERPFIWVKQSEHNQILEKIATEKKRKTWASPFVVIYFRCKRGTN